MCIALCFLGNAAESAPHYLYRIQLDVKSGPYKDEAFTIQETEASPGVGGALHSRAIGSSASLIDSYNSYVYGRP